MTHCPTCQCNILWCKCATPRELLEAGKPSNPADSVRIHEDEAESNAIPPDDAPPDWMRGAVNSLLLHARVTERDIVHILRSHIGPYVMLLESDMAGLRAAHAKLQAEDARIIRERDAVIERLKQQLAHSLEGGLPLGGDEG